MNAIQWSSAERVLSLPATFGIGQAAEMHKLAAAALFDGASFTVDASQVSEIDTAALQLLACLWRTTANNGGRCSWRGPVPPPVRRASRLIGLYALLQFPTDEKG